MPSKGSFDDPSFTGTKYAGIYSYFRNSLQNRFGIMCYGFFYESTLRQIRTLSTSLQNRQERKKGLRPARQGVVSLQFYNSGNLAKEPTKRHRTFL